MTTEDKKQIREIQSVLQSIDNGVNIFFNVTQYTRLGLVTKRNKWGVSAVGNKIQIGSTFHLTPKAKNYLKVIV